MLELIDQSNPSVSRYRCPTCGMEGRSTQARADDDYFWAPTPRGPKAEGWVQHECAPIEPEEVAVAPRRRAKRAAAP